MTGRYFDPCADKNENTIKIYLNEDLKHIEHYFDTNDLIINLQKDKTETTIFGTGLRLSTINRQLDVSYKGQIINNVSEYKYLGNYVDPQLNFNNSFDKAFKKASGRLHLLLLRRFYAVISLLKLHTTYLR